MAQPGITPATWRSPSYRIPGETTPPLPSSLIPSERHGVEEYLQAVIRHAGQVQGAIGGAAPTFQWSLAEGNVLTVRVRVPVNVENYVMHEGV